ncbi:hypothetical protein D3C85_1782500 [compost metagenome]
MTTELNSKGTDFSTNGDYVLICRHPFDRTTFAKLAELYGKRLSDDESAIVCVQTDMVEKWFTASNESAEQIKKPKGLLMNWQKKK